MSMVHDAATDPRPRFANVLAGFHEAPGLPMADVLDAATVERVFDEHDARFAEDEIYSTPLVLWAFLHQTLCDGKDSTCSAAVARIATYQQQLGRAAPCGDTGDYCRARAKLDPTALRQLSGHIARRLEQQAPDAWRWRGRSVKLFDGFTFSMPDTPANQHAYPQPTTQKPGLGFPMVRAGVVVHLGTAAVHDLAIAPYAGKQTGETALLRKLYPSFEDGDVALFDNHLCTFMNLAQLQQRGVDVCTRLHHRRKLDLKAARKIGDGDYLAVWTRGNRPDWMPLEEYQAIPRTLTLRIIECEIHQPHCRVQRMTIVTTLLDPQKYDKRQIARLYHYRWNVELDIRNLKHTFGLDRLRCKSPAMIERELWTTLLGYNLIRTVIARAAARHSKQPRQLSFATACQQVTASWMLRATGACRDPRQQAESALQRIARAEVADRPGRVEPRAVKRRPKPHKLMNKPRDVLRAELQKHNLPPTNHL